MKRDYSKAALLKYAFDRHGRGVVDAYGCEGHAGTFFLRTEADVKSLPADLRYVWQD